MVVELISGWRGEPALKAVWKAFNGAFQRMVHRRRPAPVQAHECQVEHFQRGLFDAPTFVKVPTARATPLMILNIPRANYRFTQRRISRLVRPSDVRLRT
nr:hypothetical protein [Micromonospora peucetia]